jgi:hypothetical protein
MKGVSQVAVRHRSSVVSLGNFSVAISSPLHVFAQEHRSLALTRVAPRKAV